MSNTCKLSKRGLALFYSLKNRFEIGIDEAGRGPMFGRVYAAAVVLPRNPDDFDHDTMRDSKKIKSVKNMEKAAMDMDFIQAAHFRDEIERIQNQLKTLT